MKKQFLLADMKIVSFVIFLSFTSGSKKFALFIINSEKGLFSLKKKYVKMLKTFLINDHCKKL